MDAICVTKFPKNVALLLTLSLLLACSLSVSVFQSRMRVSTNSWWPVNFRHTGLGGDKKLGTTDLLEVREPRQQTGGSWPSQCRSRYDPFTHLRTKTPPLDYQWIALHKSVANASMKGPSGEEIPLKKLGELPLINNTVYSFNSNVSGKFLLFAGGETEPLATFLLHPHGCACPQSLQEFSKRYECSAEAVQVVKKSMASFPKNAVTREIFEHHLEHQHSSSLSVHFAIINNTLYCKKHGASLFCPIPEGNRMWPVLELLQRVLRRVSVPDVWLTYNPHDGPMLQDDAIRPVFSGSGSEYHKDFLLPTPYMAKSKPTGWDIESAVLAPSWEERIAKAYFVGSLTGGPAEELKPLPGALRTNARIRAAELSLDRPDLLNVSVRAPPNLLDLTKVRTLEHLQSAGVLTPNYINSEATSYKYALDINGNSASWELGNKFGTGAMTIKNKTPYNEYWHNLLEDGRNVRLAGQLLDDVLEIVEDSQSRDQDMKCIAREAQLTALLSMRQEDMLCWTAHSLVELSNIMAFKPSLELDTGLVEVPDKHLQDAANCTCT